MERLKAYRVFLAMSVAQAFANALMFTVIAVYYVTRAGMNPLQLVLVGTVLEGTIFVFEIPTGVVADTYSRRLSVIIGMFVIGAAFVVEGLVPLFATILLTQATRGLGETFLSGATGAWLADEIGQENVGAAFVRSGQVRRVAGILGALASVALASIQINLPIVIGGGLYLALGVYLWLRMPETGFRPAPREKQTARRSLSRTFRAGVRVVRASPVLLTILGIGFFWGAASEGFDRLWEAHLLTNFAFPALGALQPVVWFGVIRVTADLVTLGVNEVFRRRVETISRAPGATARWLFVLNGLSICGVIAFALAGSFGMAVLALLARNVLGSFIYPLHDAWLIQNIDPQVRATVLSMNGQANAIGQVAGGPGIGVIGNAFLIRAAIAAAGLLLAPAMMLIARTIRQGSREPELEGVENVEAV